MSDTNEFEFDASAIADGIRQAAEHNGFFGPDDEDLPEYSSAVPEAYAARVLRKFVDEPDIKPPTNQPYTEQDLRETILQVLHDIETLTFNKHSNYGRNLQRHGLRGIVIRMSDKMMRLENMVLAGREDAVGEAIEDTLRDLIGYPLKALALLALNDLSLQGEWADHNGMSHRMRDTA